MRTKIYQPSRLTLFFTAYLLACIVQAAHLAVGGAPAHLSGVLNSKFAGYLAGVLLVWDGVQELRGRRLCFSCEPWLQGLVAGLLIAGLAGVFALANVAALDVHQPWLGPVFVKFFHPTSGRPWFNLGYALKTVGALGAVLVLAMGRRPPGH